MPKIKFLIVWLTLFQTISLHANDNIEQYLFQFLETFAHKIDKELNLKCNGKSGDLKRKIEEINIKLSTNRRASIEEARGLHVYVMDKLIQAVNEDEKLQPYFFEHPFNFQRVSVSINFYDPNNECYFDGTVTRVFNINELGLENKNKVFFEAKNPFINKIYDLLEEPYEEAVRLTDLSQLKFPYTHAIKEQEVEMDRLFESIRIELHKKHGIYLLSIGGKTVGGIEEIGAKLRFFEPVTIQEARNLEFLVINKLLNSINQNENLKIHLKEYPFPTDRLKISIEFLKKTGAPFYNGSIDEVKFDGNEFAFLSKPPDPEEGKWRYGKTHHEPSVYYRETYEEALANFKKSLTYSN